MTTKNSTQSARTGSTRSPQPSPAPEVPVLPQDDLLRLTSDPEQFFRTYLRHHCRNDFNEMHQYSFEQYKAQHIKPLPGRTGRRLAIAAPRGAAKSTVHTMLFPIMDILSGRERHQVIISGTMQQAKNRLATISRELRTNPVIRDAFFGGRMPRFKSNSKYIEIGKCRIEAHSAGSEMRGIAHGEYRPTRIILDDVEQSRFSGKAYLRKKLLNWYDETVENLGDSYTHITIVGTILHTDSLLSTLLNRPGYKSKLYKSIITWDTCPELWRTWQRLYTDRSNPEAVESAEAYLAENREAMLAGTEVLWPSKEPYEKLQERLLISGRSAFFKEKQNSPIKDGDQLFDTSLWRRFISPDGHIKVVPHALTLEQEEALEGEWHRQPACQDPGANGALEEETNAPAKAAPSWERRRPAGQKWHRQPACQDPGANGALEEETNAPAKGAPSWERRHPAGQDSGKNAAVKGEPQSSSATFSKSLSSFKSARSLSTSGVRNSNNTATKPPAVAGEPPALPGNALPGGPNLRDLKYYGFLDPALGRATSRDGDYAAIVTVGKAPDNTLYVMNVWMEKASPMKQVEQVFALHQHYRYEKFGFESNGFQETLGTFIRDKQTKLRKAGGHWHLPIEKFDNRHSKHSRISQLEPHILSGSILFQQDLPHEFYNQADEYNGSRSVHDDGLDALASCVELIRASEKRPIQQIVSVKRHIGSF